MKVHIVGTGPGDRDYLLPVAKKVVQDADCLIGAKRLVRLFRHLGKEEILLEGSFSKALSYIHKNKGKKKIAVLVSGDPGIYSFSGNISRVLKPAEFEIIPGISTIQLAFAKIGEPWRDADIISLHGKEVKGLASRLKYSSKTFLFTDPGFPPNRIASHLLREGIENRRAVVLEKLSYPDERVIDTDLKNLSKMNDFSLCALIIESLRSKKGKLYGIGIGPGDPKLLTLKAKEILDRVDTIFVPKGSEDGESCAQSIIEEIISEKKNFIELTFPMTKDKSILNKYWFSAAKKIAKEVKKKKEVAFVTIGDPLIYSTYIYLLKTLQKKFPHVDVETIPGISAFNAAASAVNLPLAEGDERLAVLPVRKDLMGLRETLEDFQTVVLMKVGSKLSKVISLLKELNLLDKAALLSHVGDKNQKIARNLSSLKGKKAGYMSVILVRKGE